MIYVTSLDGSQVEPLIDIGADFSMDQDVNGAFSVSFTSTPSKNNPGYTLLAPEVIVTIEDYDFVVKQYDDTGFSKRIAAVSTFFEQSKTQVDGIFSGSHTLQNHINFALNPSGWSAIIDPDIANVTNYINNFGNDSVVSLVNKACARHEVEFIILPGKVIRLSKQIGPDNDYQYRYKNNISDVVSMEDTTNLYTYIRGFGAEGLEVSWTSPNIGKFGKKEPSPIRDDRFTDPVALTNYIKNSIKDVPEITIESTVPELTARETGERVWLIYDPIGIEFQTRILKQTRVFRNGKLVTDSVTLGNTLRKTSTDSALDQQDSIDDNKDYLEDSKDKIQEDIFMQWTETEERIIDQYNTITSEYTASISANAREIRTEMTQKETNINNTIGAQYNKITSEYTSSISQTAQSLRQEFNASIVAVGQDITDVRNYASTIEQSASQISQTVSAQQVQINNQGTRISSAESSIIQQSNQISQKVSQTDYNGRTITSLINQDPYSVTIEASKINLNGAVMVNGSISGATKISVSTDIDLGRMIRFSDMTAISSDGGQINIEAWNGTNFVGRVDFSNATVSGLGGLSASKSTSGGKSYLTFRQDGSYLGMVEVT